MAEMEVVDARRPGWFWSDNVILDVHAAKVGVHAFAVYMALVRHANSDGQCWPSTGRIATMLGVSTRTVVKAIHALEAYGLIRIEARTAPGKGQITHKYTLVHRDEIRPPVAENVDPPMHDVHTPYEYGASPPMHEVHTNKTKINKTHLTTNDGAAGKQRRKQPPSEVEVALKSLGIRADQRREILKAQPDITPVDLAPWQSFYAAPPPWCNKPEAYIYKSLKNGDPVPAERVTVARPSTMPDPSDQAAFRAYLNGAR